MIKPSSLILRITIASVGKVTVSQVCMWFITKVIYHYGQNMLFVILQKEWEEYLEYPANRIIQQYQCFSEITVKNSIVQELSLSVKVRYGTNRDSISTLIANYGMISSYQVILTFSIGNIQHILTPYLQRVMKHSFQAKKE